METKVATNAVNRERIAETERRIRPYIRRTPVVEVDGGDFGLDSIRLVLKLESLQHTGSFKPRGAFANLLMREVPAAGVVAATGGNHGAAVAYAAQRLGSRRGFLRRRWRRRRRSSTSGAVEQNWW